MKAYVDKACTDMVKRGPTYFSSQVVDAALM